MFLSFLRAPILTSHRSKVFSRPIYHARLSLTLRQKHSIVFSHLSSSPLSIKTSFTCESLPHHCRHNLPFQVAKRSSIGKTGAAKRNITMGSTELPIETFQPAEGVNGKKDERVNNWETPGPAAFDFRSMFLCILSSLQSCCH